MELWRGPPSLLHLVLDLLFLCQHLQNKRWQQPYHSLPAGFINLECINKEGCAGKTSWWFTFCWHNKGYSAKDFGSWHRLSHANDSTTVLTALAILYLRRVFIREFIRYLKKNCKLYWQKSGELRVLPEFSFWFIGVTSYLTASYYTSSF